MVRTDEEYIEAVKNSISLASTCRYLGLQAKGPNNRKIKKIIEKYNLDISHFTKRYCDTSVYGKKPLETYLKENRPYSSSTLRKRLLEEGYKEHKCEICGIKTWNGMETPLELHHINENHYDNRLENLMLVCPNCHAVLHKTKVNTDYSMHKHLSERKIVDEIEEHKENEIIEKKRRREEKKKRELRYCVNCGKVLKSNQRVYCSQDCAHAFVSKRPPYDEFLKKIKEIGMNYTKLSKFYGVSDKTIAKWVFIYKIPFSPQEICEV